MLGYNHATFDRLRGDVDGEIGIREENHRKGPHKSSKPGIQRFQCENTCATKMESTIIFFANPSKKALGTSGPAIHKSKE